MPILKKYCICHIYKKEINSVENYPNTTLIDFWKSFNVYMSIKHIDATWQEVSQKNMAGVWKALCPQYSSNNLEAFQDEDKEIFEDLVEIFEKLDIDLHKENFQELLGSDLPELSNLDFQKLECMQRVDNEDDEVMSELKKFETKFVAEELSLTEKAFVTFEIMILMLRDS